MKPQTPIVLIKQFIRAIRDAGYKGTPAAVAELVDNSFEAEATTVSIQITSDHDFDDSGPIIIAKDDGTGMSPKVLKTALQFGGSTRFNSRSGTGRFGMGLPNSSVSQARRVDVYTWTNNKNIWWSYLDIDEIINLNTEEVPIPKKRRRPFEIKELSKENHGTMIIWSKCDRLSQVRLSTLINKLNFELGRIFRNHLYNGKKFLINNKSVQPVDPLMFRKGNNLIGAKAFGPSISYDISIPNGETKDTSQIKVRFVELPVSKWRSLQNSEKRKFGISKNAGVSVLRCDREIDYGWFFMGNKRKENYDDWWRCEIEFQPDLDELFGVTHTKQGITPKEKLLSILSPDIGAIAHKLNSRTREHFVKIKEREFTAAEKRAAERDVFFDAPKIDGESFNNVIIPNTVDKNPEFRIKSVPVKGLLYRLNSEPSDTYEFYRLSLSEKTLEVTLNSLHPFFEKFYLILSDKEGTIFRPIRKQIELMIFAAARAETLISGKLEREHIERFRANWSNLISAFLS